MWGGPKGGDGDCKGSKGTGSGKIITGVLKF